jgi:hypothetical protein
MRKDGLWELGFRLWLLLLDVWVVYSKKNLGNVLSHINSIIQ